MVILKIRSAGDSTIPACESNKGLDKPGAKQYNDEVMSALSKYRALNKIAAQVKTWDNASRRAYERLSSQLKREAVREFEKNL
jgi:hypothetical protein